MKKKCAAGLILSAVLLLSACGGGGNTVEENVPAASTAAPAQTSKSDSFLSKLKPASVPEVLYPGVYTAGDDIAAGGVVLTCTETSWSMQAILFESAEDYEAYHASDRDTVGEEMRAIESYALADLELYEDDSGYIGIGKGNVLLITDGTADCRPAQEDTEPAAELFAESEEAICSGIYTVGADIREGRYTLSVTDSEWSMDIIVFASVEDYLLYHQTRRWTNGEEWDAISQYSQLEEYLYEGSSFHLNLKSGNVLMLRGGSGLLQSEEGSTGGTVTAGEAQKVYRGAYFVGTDLDPAAYVFTCKETTWDTQVIVFKTRDDYLNYLRTERGTNGEESAAIELNAFADLYADEEECAFLNLQDGMVVVFRDGSGVLETVSPCWK